MPFDPYIVLGYAAVLSVPVVLLWAMFWPHRASCCWGCKNNDVHPRCTLHGIAHYATTTFRDGVVIDTTPEVRYGERVYVTNLR